MGTAISWWSDRSWAATADVVLRPTFTIDLPTEAGKTYVLAGK
jgi:hypothetical protein